MGVKVTGDEAMRKKLRDMSRVLERDMPSLLAQEARGLAVEFGRATGPGLGLTEKPINKLKKRIEGDVRRAAASRDAPSRVYAWLKVVAPDYAAAYWRAAKQESKRGMTRVLKQAGVLGRFDAGAVQKARTKSGSVPAGIDPVTMGTETEIKRVVKDSQSRAGMAKAGWYAAAASFGGRVRRTVRTPDGKRRSEQIFPASVRGVARRFSGLGKGWVEGVGMKAVATIENRVRHAASALPDSLYNRVFSEAGKRLNRALFEALKAVNRRKTAGRKSA
jgi:hypothetical protein